MKTALEQVEYVYDRDLDYWYCPWCETGRHLGHSPDCLRQQALQEEKVNSQQLVEAGYHAGAEALAGQVSELREVLNQVEWIHIPDGPMCDSYEECPWCWGVQGKDGHSENCQRQLALAHAIEALDVTAPPPPSQLPEPGGE